MNTLEHIKNILSWPGIEPLEAGQPYPDELYIRLNEADFPVAAKLLHKHLDSAVMTFFAEDRRQDSGAFRIYCVFLCIQTRSWVFLCQDVKESFVSLARDIYSASAFEREIKEMFGIYPEGHPDPRSLRLHEESWPSGEYPLRKDFKRPQGKAIPEARYTFKRVEGKGIFEVPVGPVHAGIIAPGHFRFSCAGEPIINLEIRLGWTHRGIEKLLEGKLFCEAPVLLERVSGEAAFGYSWAFCRAAEKILKTEPGLYAEVSRCLYLELERLYNHVGGISGMALDVGFTFPAQFASLIKEDLLRLNAKLCGSRYLRGINKVGGINNHIDKDKDAFIRSSIMKAEKELFELEEMLFTSTSFMDRVDSTGVLLPKTSRDLGVSGFAARASGIGHDLRKVFPGAYKSLSFEAVREHSGDAAARLKLRFSEAKESFILIRQCLERLAGLPGHDEQKIEASPGFGLGYAEAWRGPVLVWLRLGAEGRIERCKITEASFRNWDGLSYAVLGNIIPDFPLCNKSFDLSYSGSDL